MSEHHLERDTASRVIVSYPADLSEWGRWQLDERSVKAYLRRTETAEEGAIWDLFLDVGCCGDTYDVPLRVESVVGGSKMDESTEIVYEEREACGVGGGWSVQSAAGPDSSDQDRS